MSDDVIDLDAARKQVSAPYEPSRVLRRKRDGGRPWCPHKHYVVSMTEAEVECADCQAPLDPWTVLRSLATEQERLWVAVALEPIMAAYPDLFPQAGKPCPVCGSKPGAMCVEIGTGDPRPPHEARLATPGSGPLFGGAT